MCEQFVSASELASKVFITIQFLCDGIKGFLETAPVIFIGLLRLEKRSTEKKTPKKATAKRRQLPRHIRKFTLAQILILVKFYSIT